MPADEAPAARTRFIESFDTIRFLTSTQEERNRRLRQAEVELLTSLLYGDRMIASEPMSFDSIGFLEIADRVLRARETYLRDHRLDGCIVAKPFALAWRRGWDTTRTYGTFSDMVAHHFAREHHELMLSAWPELTTSGPARRAMASLLEDGDMVGVERAARDHARHADPADATALEKSPVERRVGQLARVTAYFDSIAGGHSTAVSPHVRLADFIHLLERYCSDPEKAARWDSDLVGRVHHQIRQLEYAGISFDARNTFYTGMIAEKLDSPDPEALELITEFLDGAYNRVVQASLGSRAGTFSTKGAAEREPIRIAEELTTTIDNLAQHAPQRMWLYDFRIQDDDGSETDRYEGADLESLWQAFWEIVGSPGWQESIARLNAARESAELTESTKGRASAEATYREAFENHTQFLQHNMRRRMRIRQVSHKGMTGVLMAIAFAGATAKVASILLPPSLAELSGQLTTFGDQFHEGLFFDLAFEGAQKILPMFVVGTRSVRPIASVDVGLGHRARARRH